MFVESYNHQANAAKHGWKATKNHTITTLRRIDPECPVQLWDRFVPQIEATLNIIQTSRIKTTKSAYKALSGRKFDWNRAPLAPVGHQLLTCLDLAHFLTLAPHTINTFTLGFTRNHHRLLRCWNKITKYQPSSRVTVR